MWERKILGLCLSALFCIGGRPAAADGDLALQQVRMGVARYELAEGGTLDTLARVSRALDAGMDDEGVQREVRFLRAAVSADMLFVAAYRADDTVRERLGELWKSDGSDLKARIATELQQAEGIYKDPASRISARLALVDDMGALRWDGLAKASGAWRDIALLRKVAIDLREKSASEVLAEIGDDPCASAEAGCDAIFMPFDATSRRSMAGLRALGSAHSRVLRNCDAGDPLAALLHAEVTADFEQLQSLEVRPRPRLRAGTKVDVASGNVEPVPVHLLVHVSEGAIEFGYVPTIGLGDDGELVSRAQGEPTLPKLKRVALPKSYRPFMRPVEEVVRALKTEGADSMAVGVSTEPRVPAHIVGRVFLSLRRVGHAEASLVGRGDQDVAMGVPLRVLVGDEADGVRPKPDVEVRVRLGGYSLRLGSWALDIPRVRGESGFAFDTDSLQQRVAKRRIRSAAVSFMGDVAVENVLAAVWRIAPESERLNLVMP